MIRLGFVGCGNVLGAYKSVVDRLRRRGLATVTRACGRPAQRESALGALGSVAFDTVEHHLLHASDVDVVVILTSISEHARLARLALEAGKHVLVEKPFATNWEDAVALAELSRRSSGRLVCAPFTTLSPTFRLLRRRLVNGEIGKVCSARARYGWSGPWWNEWFYREGGGCLFDLGIYSVTTLTGLLGSARRVMAMTGVAIPERNIGGKTVRVEAEDNAHVLLDFGNGASAVVTTGFTMQQYRSPAVEIYGTTGVIQMLGDDWDPDGHESWQNDAGCWQLYKETDPDWPWTDGLRELVEAIAERRTPRVSVDHALHVLEILLAARRSGKEGSAVALATRFDPAVLDSPENRPHAEPAHLVHDRTREHA